jgi:hypothetical protein
MSRLQNPRLLAGIGPISALPDRLKRHGLWELNEAFAVQTVYCRDTLGIPNEKLNVNGGAISDRPPVRRQRCAHADARPHRRQAPRRQVRRRHNVHRRRHGAAGLFEVNLN